MSLTTPKGVSSNGNLHTPDNLASPSNYDTLVYNTDKVNKRLFSEDDMAHEFLGASVTETSHENSENSSQKLLPPAPPIALRGKELDNYNNLLKQTSNQGSASENSSDHFPLTQESVKKLLVDSKRVKRDLLEAISDERAREHFCFVEDSFFPLGPRVTSDSEVQLNR